MDMHAVAQQALTNATQNTSHANYGTIITGFADKGIPESDIKPRENVFTFHAWKALGRSVRKGEHGVKVCTWIPMTKKDAAGESQPIGRKPRMTTVFHVSQTELIPGTAAAQQSAVQHDQRIAAARSINEQAQALQSQQVGVTLSAEWIQAHAEKDDPRPAIKPNADYYSTEFKPIG